MGGSVSKSYEKTENYFSNRINQSVVNSSDISQSIMNNSVSKVTQKISNSSSNTVVTGNELNWGPITATGNVTIDDINQSINIQVNFKAINKALTESKLSNSILSDLQSSLKNDSNLSSLLQGSLNNISKSVDSAKGAASADLAGLVSIPLPWGGSKTTSDSEVTNSIINTVNTNVSNNIKLSNNISNIVEQNLNQVVANKCSNKSVAQNIINIASISSGGDVNISEINQSIRLNSIASCLNLAEVGTQFLQNMKIDSNVASERLSKSNVTADSNASTDIASKNNAKGSTSSISFFSVIIIIIIIIVCYVIYKSVFSDGGFNMYGRGENNYNSKKIFLIILIVIFVIIIIIFIFYIKHKTQSWFNNTINFLLDYKEKMTNMDDDNFEERKNLLQDLSNELVKPHKINYNGKDIYIKAVDVY